MLRARGRVRRGQARGRVLSRHERPAAAALGRRRVHIQEGRECADGRHGVRVLLPRSALVLRGHRGGGKAAGAEGLQSVGSGPLARWCVRYGVHVFSGKGRLGRQGRNNADNVWLASRRRLGFRS